MNERWKELAIMLAACLVTLPVPAFADAPTIPQPPSAVVAVLDFSASNISAGQAATISGFVRQAAVRADLYRVIDEKNMRKLLSIQAAQQTGCTDQTCAVRLGRILNARKVIVGEYAMVDDARFLTASLVDVETGNILSVAKVKAFAARDADAAADRLIAQLYGLPPPIPEPPTEETRPVPTRRSRTEATDGGNESESDAMIAWTAREDGDEMLSDLAKGSGGPGGAARRPLVLAACDCARIALPYARKGDNRALVAIRTAERWARKEGPTLKEVMKAAEAAIQAARDDADEKSWDLRQDGDEMLQAIARVSTPPGSDARRPIVLAACECARLALPFVRKGENRPLRAIETAERWARGKGATLGQVEAAADAAYKAAVADFISGSTFAETAASFEAGQSDYATFAEAAAIYGRAYAAFSADEAACTAAAVAFEKAHSPSSTDYTAARDAALHAAYAAAAGAGSRAATAYLESANGSASSYLEEVARMAGQQSVRECASIVRRYFPKPPITARNTYSVWGPKPSDAELAAYFAAATAGDPAYSASAQAAADIARRVAYPGGGVASSDAAVAAWSEASSAASSVSITASSAAYGSADAARRAAHDAYLSGHPASSVDAETAAAAENAASKAAWDVRVRALRTCAELVRRRFPEPPSLR